MRIISSRMIVASGEGGGLGKPVVAIGVWSALCSVGDAVGFAVDVGEMGDSVCGGRAGSADDGESGASPWQAPNINAQAQIAMRYAFILIPFQSGSSTTKPIRMLSWQIALVW